MKPRKNYRSRPKKSGARKKQRVQSQKKRLITGGYDTASLDKLTNVAIRDLLKKAGKKKSPAVKAPARTKSLKKKK